jgi:gluconolactonase
MSLEVVATGLQFPEGPIAMTDGSVLLVEIRRQTLSRVSPDGQITVVAHLGGGPNGAAIGPDGRVYVCNNGGLGWVDLDGGLMVPHRAASDYAGGSIQAVDLTTGAVETLYVKCDGRPLSAPNDIVFDSHGGFWFTDLGKENETTRDYGAIYYAKTDGSFISRQRDRISWPNGCGLSPDEKTLYVAETWTCRLWAYDLSAPGVLEPAAAAYLPGRHVLTLADYLPFDSLAVQANGDICVATGINGGVTVVTPSGEANHVPVPDFVTTNICFGGADMKDAWITGSSTGNLFKTRWAEPGLKLAFNA